MDLNRMIVDLRVELHRVETAIAQLEALNGNGNIPLLRRRRGRKSMGPEERHEVSERMKRYWASQRPSKGAA